MDRVTSRSDSPQQFREHTKLQRGGIEWIEPPTAAHCYRAHHPGILVHNEPEEPRPALLASVNRLLQQARRSWAELDSASAFCEIPATAAGIIAMQQLISEGLNTRVTRVFGLQRYQQVLHAYMQGIEARLLQGKPVRHIASIANLSAGLIDSLADPVLNAIIAQHGEQAELANAVQGNIACAINTLAHQINRDAFRSEHFQRLAARGVRRQCLFVSCDHCGPVSLAADDVKRAQRMLQCLPGLGIDIEAISERLESATQGLPA